MSITKEYFRDRVREELGDEERVSGTATSGSLTTVVDTNILTQTDNYWRDRVGRIFIKTTTNGLAPEGESRRIASSTQSTKTVTVELPFSAAVEAGDTYGIAVFSNARLDNIITGLLKEFSKYRPQKFNETLTVSSGNNRFAPTSAASIRYINRIHERDVTAQLQIEYRGWVWDDNVRQIEFPFWFSETKTLTIYGGKTHALPGTENGNMTITSDDEDDVIKLCALDALLSMSNTDFKNDFGQLRPRRWTRGEVSEEYGDSYEKLRTSWQEQKEKILARYKGSVSVNVGAQGMGKSKQFTINYQNEGEPDWVAPPMFWTATPK
jgi:hypothetical protein